MARQHPPVSDRLAAKAGHLRSTRRRLWRGGPPARRLAAPVPRRVWMAWPVAARRRPRRRLRLVRDAEVWTRTEVWSWIGVLVLVAAGIALNLVIAFAGL